jgi:hypothetical protein
MVTFSWQTTLTLSVGAAALVSSPISKQRSLKTNYFFFDEDFLDEDFFFDEDFLLGTLPPALRASDNPMAIACFLLVTFFPDRPLFSVPSLRSCIAFSTFSEAFLPYLAIVRSSFVLVLPASQSVTST